MSYNDYRGGYDRPVRANRSHQSEYRDRYDRENRRSYRYGSARRNDYPPRKRSGAKKGRYVRGDEQVPFISGWMVRNKQIVSIICVPALKGVKTASENSEKWVAKISHGVSKPEIVTAFYHPDTKKVTIPDLQLVLNPNAPNGGFCGNYFKRKNRR